jgi:hypothetical protein
VIPPIKAASSTNDTISKGNTNRPSIDSPSNSVVVFSPTFRIGSEPKKSMETHDISTNSAPETMAAIPRCSLSRLVSYPIGARVIMIPNKNRTTTAPMYTSTSTQATNSAERSRKRTAVPASVATR